MMYVGQMYFDIWDFYVGQCVVQCYVCVCVGGWIDDDEFNVFVFCGVDMIYQCIFMV